MPVCIFCRKPVEMDDKVFHKDVCPHCDADLHACVQCRFYEIGRNNDCREVRAERVVVKDRANHCDYFEFGAESYMEKASDEAKRKLESLFKK